MATTPDETRDGVPLTHLDQPLFEGAGATKRDLIDYLEALADPLVAALADRPLSVIRVHRGDEPFMQKNLPSYAPAWIRTVTVWSPSSKRDVSYAVCDDRRTLLWFGNQRAVEYHPGLATIESEGAPTHLVLDLDPPPGDESFPAAVAAALLVRQALAEVGLVGAAKTSGAKGVHVFVPVEAGTPPEASAAATRAIAARAVAIDPVTATTAFLKDEREGKVFVDATRAGGATVVAAYSPRLRPGLPVSYPVRWDDLGSVAPADFTIRTAPGLLRAADLWADQMPAPQVIPPALIGEGESIPAPRVQAMHEGKRRSRARRRS